MNWKLVRVIKVHANEMILASRIQKSNLALRWDRIWEDTRNLQGEKDAACAREKFRRICPDPDIEEEDMESIVYDYMRADHEGGNYRHVRAVFIFQAKKWTVAEFHDHGGPTAPPLKTLPFPTTTKRQESEKS